MQRHLLRYRALLRNRNPGIKLFLWRIRLRFLSTVRILSRCQQYMLYVLICCGMPKTTSETAYFLQNIRDYVLSISPVPTFGTAVHSAAELWLYPFGYMYNRYPDNVDELVSGVRAHVDSVFIYILILNLPCRGNLEMLRSRPSSTLTGLYSPCKTLPSCVSVNLLKLRLGEAPKI